MVAAFLYEGMPTMMSALPSLATASRSAGGRSEVAISRTLLDGSRDRYAEAPAAASPFEFRRVTGGWLSVSRPESGALDRPPAGTLGQGGPGCAAPTAMTRNRRRAGPGRAHRRRAQPGA